MFRVLSPLSFSLHINSFSFSTYQKYLFSSVSLLLSLSVNLSLSHRVGLDGERFVEVINPLPVDGGDFYLKSRLIGVHKRGSGASVEMEQIIEDAQVCIVLLNDNLVSFLI